MDVPQDGPQVPYFLMSGVTSPAAKAHVLDSLPSFASSGAQGADWLLRGFFCLSRLRFTPIILLITVLDYIPLKSMSFASYHISSQFWGNRKPQVGGPAKNQTRQVSSTEAPAPQHLPTNSWEASWVKSPQFPTQWPSSGHSELKKEDSI